MRMRFILLMLSVFTFGNSYAQTFTPDDDGYVSAPAFHQLIKSRGYQLVSAFDTLTKKPLVMYAKVMLNGRWLYINNSGKIVSEQMINSLLTGRDYHTSYTEEGPKSPDHISSGPRFKQVSVNSKYGTIDNITGKVGLPAIYDVITPIGAEMMKIQLKGKSGLALQNGTIIEEPHYDGISSVWFGSSKNYRQFIKVSKNGQYGLLSAIGTQILPAIYTRIEYCSGCDLKGNLLIIEKDNKCGLSSISGKIVLQPIYESINSITFRGQMMVTAGQGKDKRYGLIDSLGKVLMPPVYSGKMEYLFDEKLLKIYNETANGPRYGLASIQGKILLAPIYEDVMRGNGSVLSVKQNGKEGAININGKTIAEPIYDHIFPFPNSSFILLNNKNKYGLMSLTGTVIFPVVYDEVIPGKHSFVFKKNDKWGIMDAQGKIIMNLDYDDLRSSRYNCLIVSKNNKQGIISTEGKPIIPLKYERFVDKSNVIKNGLAVAISNGTRVTIDRYGNEYPD